MARVNPHVARVVRERVLVNVNAEHRLELVVEPVEAAAMVEPFHVLPHEPRHLNLLVCVCGSPEDVQILKVEGAVSTYRLAHEGDYLCLHAGLDKSFVEDSAAHVHVRLKPRQPPPAFTQRRAQMAKVVRVKQVDLKDVQSVDFMQRPSDGRGADLRHLINEDGRRAALDASPDLFAILPRQPPPPKQSAVDAHGLMTSGLREDLSKYPSYNQTRSLLNEGFVRSLTSGGLDARVYCTLSGAATRKREGDSLSRAR